MGKNSFLKKILLTTLLISGFSMMMAGANNVSAVKAETTPTYEIPENAFEIRTVEDFKTVFDGGAAYSGRNIVLMNDINLLGHEFGFNACVMAGEFSGIFEGQGYRVFNFTKNGGLFNIIRGATETSSAGIVRNLTIENEHSTFSGCGSIANINNGIIENCDVVVSIVKSCNTYGGIVLTNNGSISNCSVYFDLKNSVANSFYSIAQGGAGTITNCRYNSNEISRIGANGGDIDPTLDPFAGIEELPTLEAPTNVVLDSEDNVHMLTFTEVEGATGYEVIYKNSAGEVQDKEKVLGSPVQIATKVKPGTYHLFIKTLGERLVNKDSVEVATKPETITVLDNFPIYGLPISFAINSKVNGAGLELFFSDKPTIELSDIEVKIVGFESVHFAGYKDQILNAQINMVEYNSNNGRLYFHHSGPGFPDNEDIVFTIRLSYTLDKLIYLEELVFEGNIYNPELGTDCSLGYNVAYGQQVSVDNTKIRYIGKVYLGDKTVTDLSSKFECLTFKIKANINGVKKSTELSTTNLLKSLNAYAGEAVAAEEGWYFFAVVIENIPSDVIYETISVKTDIVVKAQA